MFAEGGRGGGPGPGPGPGGLNQLPFDPANNNKPLQFSNATGPRVSESPAENGCDPSKKRKRANIPPDGSRNLSLDSIPMGLPMSDPTAWATAMNNLGMAPMGMTGQPLLPDFDPALGMMTGIPPINPMMPGLGIVPPPIPPDMPAVKEIIHCKSCTLFPPNPRFKDGKFLEEGVTRSAHVISVERREPLDLPESEEGRAEAT